VTALPLCGADAGVHSEMDGGTGARKTAETINKVLEVDLTLTALTAASVV
jgi:hypothetical protein